jgi:uncharacterized membrane protein
LFGPAFVSDLVPRYMPGRMFWVYLVGCALVAAAVSIAARKGVSWSGLLLGIMMVLFVAMIHFPGALRQPGRIVWTIVFRELSFGGAAWMLAGAAADGWPGKGSGRLLAVGRVLITMTLALFGIEHFLHPTVLPGVPLAREMPDWVPGREIVGYVTGAALLVAASSVLLRRRTRAVAAVVGGWLVLLVVVIYGPVMIDALAQPATPTRVGGINYFFDTLLFAGVILALASAAPRDEATS